jgi:hypothetical protein
MIELLQIKIANQRPSKENFAIDWDKDDDFLGLEKRESFEEEEEKV